MGKLVRFQCSAATVSPDTPFGEKEQARLPIILLVPSRITPSFLKAQNSAQNFICRIFFMSKFIIKNKKVVLLVLISFGILGLISVKIFQAQNSFPPPFSSPYVGGGRVGVEENNLVFINDIPGETSVYNFMDRLRSEGKITFTDKTYSGMGKFIEEINGLKNNGNQSWIYYVNEIEAQVGVSNYKINKGDIISWKYEKSY